MLQLCCKKKLLRIDSWTIVALKVGSWHCETDLWSGVVDRSCIAAGLLCGQCLFTGCSQVPSLQSAAGSDHPAILIRDIVKRVKCEIANSFDAKLRDPNFKWLENWTAKVDLTLQINDTGGASPSVSYTNIYRNAFNYAAGSTSLTSNVIAAVPQTLTLTGSANYSEQAQRVDTLSFTLSLLEIKTWRQQTARYLRAHYGAPLADRFCDPGERELTGYLGLKEWIDSALYPVEINELQAGIHPQQASALKPPTEPAGKLKMQSVTQVSSDEAKQKTDAAVKQMATYLQNTTSSQSAVASYQAAAQTAMQTTISPYYAVLTGQLKQILANNLATLSTTVVNVGIDATKVESQNDDLQQNATVIYDEIQNNRAIYDTQLTDIENALNAAKPFADDAAGQEKNAKQISAAITGFTPNPPVDGLLHSVQFIVTYGGGITPNWSLLLWKGPGLTVPGMSLTGMRTDSLNIALGPSQEQDRLLLNQTITNTLTRN